MKAIVKIKYDYIEEYMEIKNKLEKAGYDRNIVDLSASTGYVLINKESRKYSVLKYIFSKEYIYNSINEFLKYEKI